MRKKREEEIDDIEGLERKQEMKRKEEERRRRKGFAIDLSVLRCATIFAYLTCLCLYNDIC